MFNDHTERVYVRAQAVSHWRYTSMFYLSRNVIKNIPDSKMQLIITQDVIDKRDSSPLY